jgi:hypothetical protein
MSSGRLWHECCLQCVRASSFRRATSELSCLTCRSPRMSEKRDGRGTTPYVTCQFPSRSWLTLSVAWIYLLSIFAGGQAAVLGLQTSFGPGFFLPQRVRHSIRSPIPYCLSIDLMAVCVQLADSQGYDYHPPLPDTEGGPLGDCAICMDAIDRPPEDVSGKSSRRGVRARASYSLAPCAHLFVGILSSLFTM